MDPAVKQGFVIGLVIAGAVGYFGWRQGVWPSKELALTGPSVQAPKPAETPAQPAEAKPVAPSMAEAPKPAQGAETPKAPPGDVAALPPPEAKPSAAAADSPAEKGAFDIVRVEPTGEAVVAGRCAANCEIELKSNGKTIDKAKADAAGNWAMTPPQLPPGDHELALAVKEPNGETAKSDQSVTVSVPETPKGEVVVVLNESNAPSKILQRPGQPPAAAAPVDQSAAREPGAPAAPEAKTPAQKLAAVSIGAVDAEKGRLFVQGTAPTGAALRVYLNNALIAQPVAGGDERWSVRIERGLTPGDYAARVDHVEAASGKVIARAEARFTYEGEVAEAGNPAAAAPAAPEVSRPSAAAPGQQATPKASEEPQARAPAAAATEPPPPGNAPSAAAPASPTPSAAPASPSTATAEADHAAVASGEPNERTPDGDPATAGAPPADQSAAAQPIPPQGARLSAAEPSEPKPSQAAAAQPSAPDAANPVIASIDTASVKRGDSLWRISRKTYGAGMRYTVIFTANEKQIRDPDMIFPGQVFVLPPDTAKGAASAR